MKVLRTIPGFTRLLVGLFLVAQFAGMVSMPRANAVPMPAGASHMHVSYTDASQDHRHHAQGRGDHAMPCGHNNGIPADSCCALHACCAGLLPLVVAIATKTAAGEPLSVTPDDLSRGAHGGRLDRPPRPLH